MDFSGKSLVKPAFLIGKTLLLAACCLCFAGCIKSKTVVKVKRDGSGDIVATQVFSKEMVGLFEAQMKAMTAARPEAAAAMDKMPDPFYNEEGMKKMAASYGKGVEFVKAVKYDKDGSRGYIAQYSFPDIAGVTLNLDIKNRMASMAGAVAPSDGMEADSESSFRFKFEKGAASSKLTVLAPAVPAKEPIADTPEDATAKAQKDVEFQAGIKQMMANGNPLGLKGNETQEQVMRKLLGGMRFTLAVEVEGANLKTGAAGKDTRHTLFDMDMGRILDDPKVMKMMSSPQEAQAGMGSSLLDFYAHMPETPGFAIAKDKETVIEFK